MATTSVTETKVASKFGEGKCELCGKTLLGKSSGIGCTCQKHLGLVGKFYLPAPTDVKQNQLFVSITKLCDLAESLGYSRGFAVTQTGGDAGTKAPTSKEFQVYTLGRFKFVKKDALKKFKENFPALKK